MEEVASRIRNINHEAIGLFQAKRYEESRAALVTALTELRHLSHQAELPSNTIPIAGPIQPTLHSQRLQNEAQLSVAIGQNDCSSNESWSASYVIKGTEDFLCYDRAFLCESIVKIEQIGSILLFNLGLFWHQEAVQSNTAVMYLKAIKMYEKSYQLAISTSTIATDSSDIQALIIAAACLHNLSHCYYVGLFKKTEAKMIEDQLTPLIEYLEDTLQDFSTEAAEILDVLSWHCNIANVQLKLCNVAPAA